MNEENFGQKNNSLMYVVGGFVLLLILAGGYMFTKMSKNNPPSAQTSANQVVEGTESEELEESADNELAESKVSNETTTSSVDTTVNTTSIAVEGGMYYFKPNKITVKKGQPVKITFTNKEGIHDFVIDEFDVQSKKIQAGQTDTIEFTPDKTGTFEFYCSVGNHRQMGMKGTLIVQ